MKLSGRQRREIEVLRFFVPAGLKHVSITGQDIEDYFAYSDRGEKSPRWNRPPTFWNRDPDGLDALKWAKNRREVQTKEWVQGIYEGTSFVWELVGELPKPVIDLMKKILPIRAWDYWMERSDE